MGPEVTARIPVRNNYDGRYFSDPYQALPTHGYTRIFERLLDSQHITTKTNTDYFEIKNQLKCGRLYYTGPIDAYFADLGWPKLEYRSLDFERVVQKDVEYFQPASVVNHPQADDNFTRIVEYKHILNQTSPHTIYFIERSKDGGDPYYPVPNKENQDLYKKYQRLAEKEENVTFVGRLANYKYFNMDQAILNALELFDEDSGIPEDEQWNDLLAPVEKTEPKIKETGVKKKKTSTKKEELAKTKAKQKKNATKTEEKAVKQTATDKTEASSRNKTTKTVVNKTSQQERKTREVSNEHAVPEKTHWCIISKKYSMKIDPEWFDHFPHASEVILPCWSWFHRNKAEGNCGFVLMDGLVLPPGSWQQELVKAMGCQVKEMDTALVNDKDLPLPDTEIQYVPNLQLIRPRFNHRMYIEQPEDAHALRRFFVSDSLIEQSKGNGKPLQIGMIQRERSRVITNIDDIANALQQALPNANITQSKLDFDISKQAEWFATKDIIIGAHGAALTNSLFITPGTIVLQIYPRNYFYQSLDPLIEQAGGIAIDWYYGESPIRDWYWRKWWLLLNKLAREHTITPPPEEIVQKVMGALGKTRTSADQIDMW